MNYKIHDPIPNIEYTKDENDTWNFCYQKLIVFIQIDLLTD